MTYVPAAGRYDRMTYNRTGRSGLLLPAISLGLWQNFGTDRPLEASRAIVAWTLRDPRVTSTLIGASSVVQLEDNVAALDRLDFGDEELAEIDRHATDSGINIWAGSSSE